MFSSCSPLIYGSGKHAQVLTFGSNRDKIRGQLGVPKLSGRTSKEVSSLRGEPFDDFVVEGPVFKYAEYSGASMAFGMTLGLSEIRMFPKALVWQMRNGGLQKVRVRYSDDGSYRRHDVSAESAN